jgi:hypothetical protein
MSTSSKDFLRIVFQYQLEVARQNYLIGRAGWHSKDDLSSFHAALTSNADDASLSNLTK